VDRRSDSEPFGVLSATDGDASRTTEFFGVAGDTTVPDEDGCLDFTTTSRRAAIRSVSDRRVTLLLLGVLGVAARGVARLLGFAPPMRLPILLVSIGAGAVGALNEGDERPVEIDPPTLGESLGRYIVGGSLNLGAGAEGAADDDLPLENGLERIDGAELLKLGEDTEPLKLRDGTERVIDGDLPGLNDGLENVRPDDLLGLIDGLEPRNDGLWLGDMDWRAAVIRCERELLLPAAGAAPTCIRGPDSSVTMTTTAIPAALRSFLAPAVTIVVSFPSSRCSSARRAPLLTRQRPRLRISNRVLRSDPPERVARYINILLQRV